MQKWWPRIELTATAQSGAPGSVPPAASAGAAAALLTVSSMARIASEDVQLTGESCFEPILAFIDSKLSAFGEVGVLREPVLIVLDCTVCPCSCDSFIGKNDERHCGAASIWR
jgi:hypothetical protein